MCEIKERRAAKLWISWIAMHGNNLQREQLAALAQDMLKTESEKIHAYVAEVIDKAVNVADNGDMPIWGEG